MRSASARRIVLALAACGLSACVLLEPFDALAPDPDEGGAAEASTPETSGCATCEGGAVPDAPAEADVDAGTRPRLRWVTTFASDGPDAAPIFGDVHATADGGAAVVTSFRGTFGLDGGSEGGYDIAVVQLDDDGNVAWSRTFGGAGDDLAKAVAVDESGAIWIAGSSTSDPVLFTSTPNPVALTLPFVAKLDGPGADPVAVGLDPSGVFTGDCNAIAAGVSGRVVVGCAFAGAIAMDAWSEPSNANSTDAIVISLDTATRTSAWHGVYGGSGTDRVEGLALAPSGDAYVVGTFDSPTFPPTAITRTGSNQNAWVVALGPGGDLRWSRGYGQTTSNGITRALSVAADPPSNVLVGGDMRGTLDFGGFDILTSSTRVAFAMSLDADAGTEGPIIGVGGTVSTTRGITVDADGGRTFLGEMMLASPSSTPEIGETALPPFGTGTAGFVVRNVGTTIDFIDVFPSNFGEVFPRRVSASSDGALTIMGRFVDTTTFEGVSKTSGALGSTFVLRLAP